MLSSYSYPRYAYRRPTELDRPGQTPRHPVLLLDDDDSVSVGSRGLCYGKRTLEILDRLGCGQPVVDKGVTWNIGRVFFGEAEVFHFNLLPEADHCRPAMVNLPQYYLEQYLVERAMAVSTASSSRWPLGSKK